jgi:hypothetical protein
VDKTIANKKMLELIRSKQYDRFIFNNNIKKLFLPKFLKVHDCIIISDEALEPNIESFKKIINKHTNKSGYEYSCNETLINFYTEEYSEVKDLVFVGLMVIEIWSVQLKAIEPENTFCFILSVDEEVESVTIFFHKYREEEGMWISDEIELFEQPTGYQLI